MGVLELAINNMMYASRPKISAFNLIAEEKSSVALSACSVSNYVGDSGDYHVIIIFTCGGMRLLVVNERHVVMSEYCDMSKG